MKKHPTDQKAQTHFEQVPVHVAKRIAYKEAAKMDKPGSGNVSIEPASKKTEPYSMVGPFAYSWRRSAYDGLDSQMGDSAHDGSDYEMHRETYTRRRA